MRVLRDVTFSNNINNNGNVFGFLRVYGNDHARKTEELQCNHRRHVSTPVMLLFSLFSAAHLLQATEKVGGGGRSSYGKIQRTAMQEFGGGRSCTVHPGIVSFMLRRIFVFMLGLFNDAFSRQTSVQWVNDYLEENRRDLI